MLKQLGLLAFIAEFASGGLGQTQRAERLAEQAQKSGVPVTPYFVRACGWTMFACAIGVLIPIPPLRRLCALSLAGMLVPITYIGHRFWEVDDEQQRRNQKTQFMKNTTMFGGALYIAGSN